MNEDWRSQEDRRIDLELENSTLERELALRGGTLHVDSDVPADIHNEFLRNIAMYEDMAARGPYPVRSLFAADYTFPAANALNEEQIAQKLDDIEEILEEADVYVDLCSDVPNHIKYEHIVTSVIPGGVECAGVLPGWHTVFDGCDGCCEECFQRQWCSTPDELDEQEADEA